MKLSLISSFAISSLIAANAFSDPINLAQPPVKCAERLVPPPAPSDCDDTNSDYEEEYCEALDKVRDILRHPSEYSSAQRDLYWMTVQGGKNTQAKISGIYEASNTVNMPPQILAGALKQESMTAEIGLVEDGGNYSCGIGQMNVQEWCQWAMSLSASEQTTIGWPASEIRDYASAHQISALCEDAMLPTTVAAPFLRSILRRMGTRPVELMERANMQGVTRDQVILGMPATDNALKEIQYKAGKSFVENCMDTRYGILGKAHALQTIFENVVPEGLRNAQHYQSGERFNAGSQCTMTATTTAYPLHAGWLLADAIYNAGGAALNVVAHYRRLDQNSVNMQSNWENFGPQELVDALYWGGRYVAGSESEEGGAKLGYTNLAGEPKQVSYFKMCVNQRHISHVVNETARGGAELTQSRQGDMGCRRAPNNIPTRRKNSSGQI